MRVVRNASVTRTRDWNLVPARALRLPLLGAHTWILDESGQHTGSFKVRGALQALSSLGAKRVVAASAGNHGAGVAYAARVLGIEAIVHVPRSAPDEKKRRISEAGATLVVNESEHYDDAETAAKAQAAREGIPFVSPYEDDRVALGNGATLARELDALRIARERPLTVIVPFGGGGLASGVAWGLPDADVWGAQSEASPAMALSLESGSALTRHEGAPTLADGLEGGIAEGAFARARALVAGVYVVTEAEIMGAMRWLHAHVALRVEGSAACAVAAWLALPAAERAASEAARETVLLVTGRNVDDARFNAVLSAP